MLYQWELLFILLGLFQDRQMDGKEIRRGPQRQSIWKKVLHNLNMALVWKCRMLSRYHSSELADLKLVKTLTMYPIPDLQGELQSLLPHAIWGILTQQMSRQQHPLPKSGVHRAPSPKAPSHLHARDDPVHSPSQSVQWAVSSEVLASRGWGQESRFLLQIFQHSAISADNVF